MELTRSALGSFSRFVQGYTSAGGGNDNRYVEMEEWDGGEVAREDATGSSLFVIDTGAIGSTRT